MHLHGPGHKTYDWAFLKLILCHAGRCFQRKRVWDCGWMFAWRFCFQASWSFWHSQCGQCSILYHHERRSRKFKSFEWCIFGRMHSCVCGPSIPHTAVCLANCIRGLCCILWAAGPSLGSKGQTYSSFHESGLHLLTVKAIIHFLPNAIDVISLPGLPNLRHLSCSFGGIPIMFEPSCNSRLQNNYSIFDPAVVVVCSTAAWAP